MDLLNYFNGFFCGTPIFLGYFSPEAAVLVQAHSSFHFFFFTRQKM